MTPTTERGGPMAGGRSLSRRAFFRHTSTLALVAAAPLAGARAAAAESSPSVSLTRSTFLPYVGQRFRMTGAGVDTQVVLTAVDDLPSCRRPDDEHAFALVFDAASGPRHPGAVRTLRNPRLGSVSLFAAPVDRGVQQQRYEAVINRA